MPPEPIEPQTAASRADSSNWRDTPHRGWAFHNVRDVLATTPIAATPGEGSALPSSPVSLEGFQLAIPGGPTLNMCDFLKASATDSLVILHDGRLVFEAYDNGITAESTHILMSVSKAMTGLVAGILHGDGVLDVEAQVADYVPEVRATAYAGATIRDLLDMRAGVVLDAVQAETYEAALAGRSTSPGGATPGFQDVLQTLTASKGPHGGPFSYISANTDLLGWAMERASGRPFAMLMSERLWKPMGAAHDASIIVDRQGSPWCSGGLSITARDFARVGQLMLDGGRRGSHEVIPETWIDDLSHGGDREAWRDGEWGAAFASIGRTMSYRSGWYAVHDTPERLFAMGVHGQNLFIDHAERLVIAKLSSQERLDYRLIGLTHMAVPELRRCVLAGAGEPAPA